MNVKEEIQTRQNIMDKVFGGIKISDEESLWLVTHRSFNLGLGYPHLSTDIITLDKDTHYTFKIKLESKAYANSIYPLFTVPGFKGEIITNFSLTNWKGEPSKSTVVQMLACTIRDTAHSTQFEYWSEFGMISVDYECEYYDEGWQRTIRKSSRAGTYDFAMLREQISENKIIYRCKNPQNGDFDALVFSVEWDSG